MAEPRNAVSSAAAQDPARRPSGQGAAPGPGGRPPGPVLHGGILGVADRFRDDDGSADPAAAVALGAFAAGTGSEHAVLLALAAARLLVPVVAELAPQAAASFPADRTDGPGQPPVPGPGQPPVPGPTQQPATSPGRQPGAAQSGPGAAEQSGVGAGEQSGPVAGEKSSDMTLPTLVGRDGRRALPAFTSLESLARWQRSARPVPADAALVWRAAVEDSCAVVIDVAGPVPLAIEGARLAALAEGKAVPAPHEDPDVQAAVGAVIAEALAGLPVSAAVAPDAPAAATSAPGAPVPGPPAADAPVTGALVGFALYPGVDGADLLIELVVAPVIDAEALTARVGPAIFQQLSSRLRRGVAITLSPPR